MAINLSKDKAINTDPKAIQQINFTRNLERGRKANATTFFIIKEVKETVLDFSQETVEVF